ELVEPELAIANLAYNNFWGFPSAETTKSYALENVKWMDTGMSGSIDITFYSDGYEIGTSRSMSVQPWYRQMLRKKVE
ncbi:DNA internalization-related competence protein ComEC/Rec2, partial [Vibrio sp.]|nr:DNA internalization-related competence protein ComEC/Rec2 [Vibrio sp.]